MLESREQAYLEFLGAGNIVALAVQIVWVERLDSLEHLLVVVVHQLVVRTGVVPGVERVVADHGEGLVRKGGLVLDDVVEVFVVAPGEHDVVQTAARAVDSELGVVDGVVEVLVVLEGLAAVDDALIEATADGECVSDDIPLTLGVEEVEQLAQVVDETGQLHPAGLAVAADGLGGLQEVLDLGEAGVRVGLVDEGVELLHGLPDGHLSAGLGVELIAGLEVVGHGLLGVLFLVEVLDPVAGVFVLTELGLVLVLVELGLFVQTLLLLLHAVLEDVDIVNGVRQLLKSLSVTLGVEHRGFRSYGDRCHCDCNF